MSDFKSILVNERSWIAVPEEQSEILHWLCLELLHLIDTMEMSPCQLRVLKHPVSKAIK